MFDGSVPLPISIVLVKTSHPGNIGSVARAMKTMGLTDLRLVQPAKPNLLEHSDALALATGAADLLHTAQQYESLSAALHDTVLAFALSARVREFGPKVQNPTVAASQAFDVCSQPNGRVAFVFGAERTGLTNEELLACNRHVFIPTGPAYSSLNLAQAVQIVAYELNLMFYHKQDAGVGGVNQMLPNEPLEMATNESVLQLQAHWLQAMEAVDFINPQKPKKTITRLARLLARAQLEKDEVDLLRGFLNDVVRVAQGRWYPHEASRLLKVLNKINCKS